ncbi:MAG: YqzL family protein [Clostridia bacterium]|nr:YqzL family protein [Clostridia bacterium]
MTNLKDGWELFSATGDIDAYLMYKSAQSEKDGNSGYGQHKNEGSDNKKH